MFLSEKPLIIMGGTFDPPHIGHLIMADAALTALNARECLFITTGSPPHKDADITDAETRCFMTAAALGGDARFAFSRIEADRDGVTYTVDTLRTLKERYGERELVWVTGADTLEQAAEWKDAGEVVKMCSFAAVRRDGFGEAAFRRAAAVIEGMGGVVYPVDATFVGVSSGDIRGAAHGGRSVRYMTAPPVARFIEKHNIYGGFKTNLTEIADGLKATLKTKRLAHSFGTAETAARLAAVYGADAFKAYTAGLAHDCAKYMAKDELFKYCDKRRIKTTADDLILPDTLHGAVGAVLAKERFGVTDEDVLEAVRWHVTGKPNMTALEKIVYIADVTEPNRDNPVSAALRSVMYADLDAAFLGAVNLKINFARSKGVKVHEMSVKTLRYIEK